MTYWIKNNHLLTQKVWVPYWQDICLNKFQKDFEIIFFSLELHIQVHLQKNQIMKVYNC